MQRPVTFWGSSRLALLACAAALSMGGLCRAEADPNVLNELYGEGVKAFFAGNYSRAAEMLTTAIDAGSKDPRAFYFRGLSRSRQGDRTAADADFKRGSEIEGRDFDAFFNVSRSIERIQGSERLMLERYRTGGRKNALAELESIRFERFRRFQPGGVATADGSAPATPAAADPAAAGAAPTAAPASPSPFGTPSMPAGESNPFSTPGTPSTPSTPGTPPAAAPSTNPFGAAAAPAAAMPADAGAPPAATPAASPFGTPAATPAAPPATPAAPATPSTNPFGGPATPSPATPPATTTPATNPFGGPATPPAATPSSTAPPANPFGT